MANVTVSGTLIRHNNGKHHVLQADCQEHMYHMYHLLSADCNCGFWYVNEMINNQSKVLLYF